MPPLPDYEFLTTGSENGSTWRGMHNQSQNESNPSKTHGGGQPELERKRSFLSEKQTYEEARERLCLHVVNYEHWRMHLGGLACLRWEDLVILFIYEEEEGEELRGNCKSESERLVLSQKDLDVWDVDIYTVFRNAALTSCRLHPPVLGSIREILNIPEEYCFGPKLYTMSCQEYRYGAATIFYPGVLAAIAESFGGDLYIIPSSVHEVLFFRKEEADEPWGLKEIICSVNRDVVLPGEVLSNSLYQFRRQIGELERVV